MRHLQLNPSRSPFLLRLLSGAGLEMQIKEVHLNFQFSLQGLQTGAEEGAAAPLLAVLNPTNEAFARWLRCSRPASARGRAWWPFLSPLPNSI